MDNFLPSDIICLGKSLAGSPTFKIVPTMVPCSADVPVRQVGDY